MRQSILIWSFALASIAGCGSGGGAPGTMHGTGGGGGGGTTGTGSSGNSASSTSSSASSTSSSSGNPVLGALDVPKLFDATDGSKDYWYTPIPANPVLDPNNAAMLAQVDVPSSVPYVNGPAWMTSLYVTHNADPGFSPTLTNAALWGCAVKTPMHIPDSAVRETPGVSAGGDAWIVTVNLDTNDVSGIWQADKSSGTWNGTCGGTFPLHGNGFAPSAGDGAGGGSSFAAGTVLLSELLSGHIDHTMYVASKVSCSSFREPAVKSDGKGTGFSCLPMGARIQLDPSVDCDTLGAGPGETAICHAAQTYGFYVLDSGAGAAMVPAIQGDDMLDPARVPWQMPGDPYRGGPNCGQPSTTCGVAASVGLKSYGTLSHIPWTNLRILARWDGT